MEQSQESSNLIRLDIPTKEGVHGMVLDLSRKWIEYFLGIPQINQLYAAMPSGQGAEEFCKRSLSSMNVTVHADPSKLAKIPKTGPVIVVANHPFGGIEGLGLASLLLSIRPDTKFIVNYMLAKIPELKPLFFTVDPFENLKSVHQNAAALRRSTKWVKDGGLLAIFPSGEVSHWHLRGREVKDPEWKNAAASIARHTGASVVPIFIEGQNSLLFQVSGMAHPRLRTALLGQELLKSRSRKIRFVVGNPIASEQIRNFQTNDELTAYLRLRTYLLAQRKDHVRPSFEILKSKPKEIIAPEQPEAMSQEISNLPPSRILLEHKDFLVCWAQMKEIPRTMNEIARLREIAFRLEGEGTGAAKDLDRFDQHYLHLFVWHKSAKEVVGAYRFSLADNILKTQGKSGLYTATLFDFTPKFLKNLDNAIEMGRSFVAPKYQKSMNALPLLWQGVFRFISRNPRYHILFGPVSISNRYRRDSKQLMVDFLKRRCYRQDLASEVRPKSGFRPKKISGCDRIETALGTLSIEEISTIVEELEKPQKGVPTLLKHYVRLGGQMVGFNLDAKFSHALDGLIVLDLLKGDRRILGRYFGEDRFSEYLQTHGILFD